jgi:hypothetical protein
MRRDGAIAVNSGKSRKEIMKFAKNRKIDRDIATSGRHSVSQGW